MSWRGRDDRGSRWEGRDRGRSPVWEPRRSPERDRYERDRRYDRQKDDRDRRDVRDRYDRDSDLRDRDSDRFRPRERYDRSDRSRERDRDRDRERRRSPRRFDDREIPSAPSPPKISADPSPKPKSRSRSRSRSHERDVDDYNKERDSREMKSEELDQSSVHASPGDWFCKCGSYNFKRRQVCYKRNCMGKRSEGTVYGGDGDKTSSLEANAGITKRLLFRRLDALTTEEKILDAIKERCSKSVLDSIVGITIGREALTGASKCLAYILFGSIADSTAAHSELLSLNPPLIIDNREVLISFYNEPQKLPKQTNPTAADYSAYYAQMQTYNAQAAALSEADRVNAAAAVAQSAISAAHARNMQGWTPIAAPTFVTSTTQAIPAGDIPTGDGKTTYSAPDVRTFMYDETSGYYYDPSTGLYYDGTTQYFYNSQINQYMYWDSTTNTYIAATQTQQNTEQPKLPNPPEATAENTIAKEPEEKKKKEKEDKVKVAKKIAKDMERWARTLNQKKENARSNIVMEQPIDMGASKGSADIGFSVLGARPSAVPQTQTVVREISPPPPIVADDFLMKKTMTEPLQADSDDGIIDWMKLTCLICKRRFPTAEVLTKHKTLSDLHKQNLEDHRKKMELMPQPNGYRDRAAERRMKFGEDEPIIRKRYSPPPAPMAPPQSAPPPNVVDTIGGKMLQKMGWSMGRGLGKTEQGRTAPVEASAGPAGAGLGAGGTRRGIYTPTPGETYRDTVKKLMIARYKEVVGQEEGPK
ncbi:hypothetical protein O0L34_g1766 [Tuta absoluta]|nr:hypothetical protein O0L34_g1766 [Tuta absoluta]